MTTEIIPFDSLQRSVALALSEVQIRKAAGKRIGANPYAKAFFRNHFGKTNPCKSELICLTIGDKTIPQMTATIDLFIEKNGGCNWDISDTFKYRAFPSLKTLDRFESRFEMKTQQKNNVEVKQKQKHEDKLEAIKESMLNLDAKELGEWVRDQEDELSVYELHGCLRVWFNTNASSDWTYHDLYSDCTPSQVAYDLSFEEF
ncbi:hypothetical protein [Vibrio crassostreae]|uniref:hypothetical protein n=1 Tax=Vibrio crassostreae TaxID=246167 RepID=UPI001B3145F7|nr:hypothetical protein [Vibrio crassostreae]